VRFAVVRVPGGHPPLPSDADLRSLVRVALSASLEREEGRDVRFTLVYTPPRADDPLRFSEPLPLRSDTIRRIAPAVDPGRGLGVSFGNATRESELRIWGVTRRREDAVEVAAMAPGRVVVRFGLTNIARFNGTRCSVPKTGATEAVEALAYLVACGPDESYVLPAYLLQLAVSTRNHGHGGTFLIVPSKREHRPKGVTVHFPLDPWFTALARRYRSSLAHYRAVWRDDEHPLYLLAMDHDIGSFLEQGAPSPEAVGVITTVSRLAAVDGAVLLNVGLSVGGAGAFVRMGSSEDKVSWREWKPGTSADSAVWPRRAGRVTGLGGARHQSASWFVRRHRGALAVVCSQDGGITILTCPPGADALLLIARHVEQAIP
jgi:hypothetical protein